VSRFIVGTVFDGLAQLESASVDLVLTSPPFLALRSYLPADHPDKHREIGSEATPADYLDRLIDVVEACDRVLAPHGSLVFELGDTYAGSGGAGGDYMGEGLRNGQPRWDGSAARTRLDGNGKVSRGGARQPDKAGSGWPLDKSLCGIPTLFAWSLAYGRNLLRPERTTELWRIRNVVVWARPNPPVGALGDKFRPATSYLTVACKSRNRYFDLDAVRTPLSQPGRRFNYDKGYENRNPRHGWKTNGEDFEQNPLGAPPLDYWVIPTEPYKGSHYATWPSDLVTRPIKAMCPERVCTVCGEPSRRIVGDAKYVNSKTGKPATTLHFDGERRRAGENHWDTTGKGDRAAVRVTPTLGWTDCGHDFWRKGVVLDPFAGSGTTLAVATGHGRDAIGIDLDPRNADLARERCGMFLEVV
jgi:site-specific DNA-methyltransferase (adenine-specific)